MEQFPKRGFQRRETLLKPSPECGARYELIDFGHKLSWGAEAHAKE